MTTWLHRIVVNASLDRPPQAGRSLGRPPLPDDDEGAPGAQVPDPDDAFDRRETQIVVAEALAQLPEDQREAVILVDIEGWSVEGRPPRCWAAPRGPSRAGALGDERNWRNGSLTCGTLTRPRPSHAWKEARPPVNDDSTSPEAPDPSDEFDDVRAVLAELSFLSPAADLTVDVMPEEIWIRLQQAIDAEAGTRTPDEQSNVVALRTDRRSSRGMRWAGGLVAASVAIVAVGLAVGAVRGNSPDGVRRRGQRRGSKRGCHRGGLPRFSRLLGRDSICRATGGRSDAGVRGSRRAHDLDQQHRLPA